MTGADHQEPSLERIETLLDRLGSVLARIDQRLQTTGATPPTQSAPTAAPLPAVLRPQGDYWSLSYGGRHVLVKDCRGVQHLSRLLARPNEPVHVLELVRGVEGPRRGGVGAAGPVALEGGAGPLLDSAARAAYRRRLAELAAGEDADAPERLLERDLLEAELRRATALHGRDRTFSDPVERARVAVTKAVRKAIRGIRARDAALGRHLERTVRTGTLCSYVVEPAVPAQRGPQRRAAAGGDRGLDDAG